MTADKPTVHRLRTASLAEQVEFEDAFGALLRRASLIPSAGPLYLDSAIQDETFDAAVLPWVRAAWKRAVGGFALDQAWEFGFQTGLPDRPNEDG